MSFDLHRAALFKRIPQNILYVQGAPSTCRFDTDRDELFRQESTFFYLTGCNEPDCAAVLDCDNKSFTLFVPRLTAEHALWVGAIEPIAIKKERYECDTIRYMDELPAYWEERKPTLVQLAGITAKKLPAGVPTLDVRAIVDECRVFKTPFEVEQIRRACVLNAGAQTEVMRTFVAGSNEYTAEAIHYNYALSRGHKFRSFETITAAGKHASTLHYVDNRFPTKVGQVMLLDGGIEYECYASDHTRTFPIGPTYTPAQRAMYSTVLAANKACIKLCRPGVRWEDIHAVSLKHILLGLREAGLVNPEAGTVDEQLALDIPAIFQPHGLGHLLGLDVHDVAGYPAGVERHHRPSYCYLRFRRTLETGMVITVEPGIYFIDGFLEEAEKDPRVAPHLNFPLIRQWQEECGGCRIEDCVLVTEDAPKVFPAAPKEIEEIERLRAGEDVKPYSMVSL